MNVLPCESFYKVVFYSLYVEKETKMSFSGLNFLFVPPSGMCFIGSVIMDFKIKVLKFATAGFSSVDKIETVLVFFYSRCLKSFY